jgi:hypothetical protein
LKFNAPPIVKSRKLSFRDEISDKLDQNKHLNNGIAFNENLTKVMLGGSSLYGAGMKTASELKDHKKVENV